MIEAKRAYCQQTAFNIIRGIHDARGIIPDKDYFPKVWNARRVISVHLQGISPLYLNRIMQLQREITMYARLPENKPVRITQDGDGIVIEVPKTQFKDDVSISDLAKVQPKNNATVNIGLDLKDGIVNIDFDHPLVAHALISGATRSGKTNTQQLMAWWLAQKSPNDTKLFVFDVAKKGYTWNTFENVHNLAHRLIYDMEEAEAVLTWLVEEMGRRGAGRYKKPRLFVVVDELKALIEDSDIAGKNLAKLAAVGGEFDIHLIVATQYPQITMLKKSGAELKRNLTTRLSGRVDDGAAAVNAMGIKGSGAETLSNKGDFLIYREDLSRFTVAELKPIHINRLDRAEIVSITGQNLPQPQAIENVPTYKPSPDLDYPDPEMLAVALFQTQGINKLQKEFGGGMKTATKIKKYADKIREFALKRGYKCL